MDLFTVNGNLSIDTSNVYIDGHKADLSVQKLSYEEYATLIKNDKCLSNTLYVIESDYLDMFGQQIVDMADPVLPQDAATKAYVDSAVSSIKIPEVDYSSAEFKAAIRKELKTIAQTI